METVGTCKASEEEVELGEVGDVAMVACMMSSYEGGAASSAGQARCGRSSLVRWVA
jgi:hypothetical protein